MVETVNTNHGFYLGRYETTIDETKSIGLKYNTTILSADTTLQDGINPNTDQPYYYRWYGLYAEQKNVDVEGNGKNVQTAMIYGVLYDKTLDFIRKNDKTYDVDNSTESWH